MNVKNNIFQHFSHKKCGRMYEVEFVISTGKRFNKGRMELLPENRVAVKNLPEDTLKPAKTGGSSLRAFFGKEKKCIAQSYQKN